MSDKLHLVFGGELESPSGVKFRDTDAIDIIGIFPSYEAAYNAWKAAAQGSVDDAHMRYFIAHLHRLIGEKRETAEDDALTQ